MREEGKPPRQRGLKANRCLLFKNFKYSSSYSSTGTSSPLERSLFFSWSVEKGRTRREGRCSSRTLSPLSRTTDGDPDTITSKGREERKVLKRKIRFKVILGRWGACQEVDPLDNDDASGCCWGWSGVILGIPGSPDVLEISLSIHRHPSDKEGHHISQVPVL